MYCLVYKSFSIWLRKLLGSDCLKEREMKRKRIYLVIKIFPFRRVVKSKTSFKFFLSLNSSKSKPDYFNSNFDKVKNYTGKYKRWDLVLKKCKKCASVHINSRLQTWKVIFTFKRWDVNILRCNRVTRQRKLLWVVILVWNRFRLRSPSTFISNILFTD